MPGTTAAYMREYRRKNREAAERNRKIGRARGRALTRLADMYPDDFRVLEDEERWQEGLPAVGSTPLGRPPVRPVPF